MLITLLAWIYISFLCYAWGILFIKLLSKIYGSGKVASYGFSITCFIGLAFIAATAQVISLFTGLSSMVIQLLFFLPAVLACFFFDKPLQYLQKANAFIRGMHPAIAFLLTTTLLMILVMGVYFITHPDTIFYHAQVIKWAEQYRVVPGLVHINYLYGLQNSWFLLCGLFSFSFTGTNALSFINTTVLAWLLIFLCQKINTSLKKTGTGYHAFLWLSFLVINLWAYTGIRLTATSASPDFIAAIYILLTAYLCFQHAAVKENELLVIFMCFFTFTIKLSALPVVVLAFYFLYPFSRIKIICFLVFFSFIVIPYITRNIVTSGHLFFPAAFPDIVHTDWKYDTNKLAYINKYILSFARTHDNSTSPEKILDMPVSSWLQKWWQYLSSADKLIIVIQFFSMLVFVFNYKNIIAKNRLKKTWILVSLTGLIFWLLKAPDPRFGAGFLLLLPSLIFSGEIFVRKTAGIFKSAGIIISLCLLSGLTIISYTTYRFINYFRPAELIAPEGIAVPAASVYYDEIKTAIPLISGGSRNITIVPGAQTTRHFSFRGKTAAEGFAEKK